MLRTLALSIALATPVLAHAEQFPQSALHAEVRGHDGAVLGEVTAVERDADGEIVAAEIPGLEPADAPLAATDLVAGADRENVSYEDSRRDRRDDDRARS